MHVKHSLSLVCFAIVGLLADNALALPFNQPGGIVRLPLKPVQQRRRDLHPQILHQQNMNRAYRRFARMAGRTEPSSAELRENLDRRLESLEIPGLRSSESWRNRRRGGQKRTPDEHGLGTTSTTGLSARATESSAAATATGQTAVTKANPPTTENSIGIDIEGNDIGFLATLQIGTPPRDFEMLMDSGSADMWVGSENCKSSTGGTCGDHNFIGPASSSTFSDSGVSWNITYGTGAVSGTKVTDNVFIAGLALPKHNFGVANNESAQFTDDSVPFDGLVGLAQSRLSEQKNLSPVEALARSNLIAAPITSYKIPRLADGKNDGQITFGGLDTTKFDPATLITLDNRSRVGFWEASMTAVAVSGRPMLNITGRSAILDTGTTLIIAPPPDALAVHGAIPGSKFDNLNGFTVPCTTTVTVELTFGGTAFAIDPRDLAIAPLNPANPNDCISGIAAGTIGGPNRWLIGGVFLKNAYFSHNVASNQMQLAKLI